MRLTVSLSLWLALATASVLGIHGWFQLQQEESDLDLVARRELSLLATAIRTGVESAVRDGQLVKVLGTGEITVAVQVTADAFSGSAKTKIEAAGGSATVSA